MKLLRCSVLFLLCSAALLRAQTLAVSMSTLQNLPAVAVEVRGLSPQGEVIGMTRAEMVRVVSTELQKVGVKVLQPLEADKQPGAPVLQITANLTRFGSTSALFILDLQLREDVKTVRKLPSLVTLPAVTWAVQDAGYTDKPATVYKKLAGLAERFAVEWTSAGVSSTH